MTTSSSRRILKRPEESGEFRVEAYAPPKEHAAKVHGNTRPSFPLYTKDGERKGDYHLVSPLQQSPLEPLEPVRKRQGMTKRQEDVAEERERAEEEEAARKQEEERSQILEEAREEARKILEEAQEQIRQDGEKARQDAMREGYEAGYREGREHGEEECRQELKRTLDTFREDMRQALKSVEIAKDNCLRTYLDELKDCAIAIGEKVIHISLKSSGDVIKRMIISATEKLKKTAWVKIYIDKCDYDMMMESDTDILDQLSHLSDNIKFIVMDKEDRGNCIIEMPEEIVDVSVSTQIENIKDILENVRV